jgi:hypothetical protein
LARRERVEVKVFKNPWNREKGELRRGKEKLEIHGIDTKLRALGVDHCVYVCMFVKISFVDQPKEESVERKREIPVLQ